jgi:dihydroorotase
MARKVLELGVKPHTLGADMHGYNVRVPNDSDAAGRSENPFYGVAPFSLTHAMTELLTLGMSLPEVVATVSSNAAIMLRLQDEIGSLQVGRSADISVLDLLKGRFALTDNSGETVVAPEMLVPSFALKAGERIAADSPLVPAPVRLEAAQ